MMKIYNFSAGPACLPETVLQAVRDAAIDYSGSGMSVMEMSHRSKPIVDLFETASSRVKDLLDIPSNYHILWLQGGASLQFSMVPFNLLSENGSADYIDTGSWSFKAAAECNKFGTGKIIASSRDSNYTFIPKEYQQNHDSCYLHITSNNTIYGTQYNKFPEVKSDRGILVADMSSDILSRSIDISQFGVIYAGAQKNIGPAGVTLVIIRDDLIGNEYREIPTMLNYKTHVMKDSMFNTPPVLSVFVVNETLKWIEDLGGILEVEKRNIKKAEKLYAEITRNSIFTSRINKEDRSMMNIPFVYTDESMDDNQFLLFCNERGLKTLKGHRSVGGFRASLYNAMPEEGVDALIHAMREFENSK